MTSSIVSIKKIYPTNKKRYDISVKGTKCFFANNILVHNSSSHLLWKNEEVKPFSGGATHQAFLNIFNGVLSPTIEEIKTQFTNEFGNQIEVCIYGEVYGGNMNAMSATYGTTLRFIVFDIKVGDYFVPVPTAERIAKKFKLDFVDYALVDATIEALDKERLKESTQAVRNGCGNGKVREGIVIKPEIDVFCKGERVMSKYKNADYEERANPQSPVDPEKRKILENAEAIADEWVVAQRLEHVLDKLFPGGAIPKIEDTGNVVKAMVEDVTREAAGEIVDNKIVRAAIGKKAAVLFKAKLQMSLRNK